MEGESPIWYLIGIKSISRGDGPDSRANPLCQRTPDLVRFGSNPPLATDVTDGWDSAGEPMSGETRPVLGACNYGRNLGLHLMLELTTLQRYASTYRIARNLSIGARYIRTKTRLCLCHVPGGIHRDSCSIYGKGVRFRLPFVRAVLAWIERRRCVWAISGLLR